MLYSLVTFVSATPNTAQFVVISGKYTPKLLYKAGMVFKEWEKKFALKEEAGHTLRAAGDAFFGENSQENLRCMQGCRQRMEKCVEKEREEFVRQRSVYMPVGMLTGLMLVILLV